MVSALKLWNKAGKGFKTHDPRLLDKIRSLSWHITIPNIGFPNFNMMPMQEAAFNFNSLGISFKSAEIAFQKLGKVLELCNAKSTEDVGKSRKRKKRNSKRRKHS